MRTALGGILAALALTGAIATDAAERAEVDFELKLLLRARGRAPVDLWSGGRLELRAVPERDGRTRLELLRPVEHPWVFRWYDERDEVKLGGEVWLPRAEGDVFGTPAAALQPQAADRWRRWWDDPFWVAVHRDETARRDPLSDPPVYPFWVLGPIDGGLSVVVDAVGRVDASSIVQRMDRPWTADGWERSRAGEPVRGTGHWDPSARARPRWAPNGYAALAAALALLDEREEPGDVAVRAVTTLLPRLEGRLDPGAAAVDVRRGPAGTRLRLTTPPPRRLELEIRIGISR